MMKKRLGSKKFKEGSPVGKKRDLSTSESRKRYEDERSHLKEVSQRASAFAQSITESVNLGKRFSGALLEWGATADSPLSTILALVASLQTALGDLQLILSDKLEEKLNGPLRDMSLLERELLNASKKDEVFRSEEMKVETFRMSLVEKFCEYMDCHTDYLKRGQLLLNNYQEEVAKTKSASRKQVEEILNSTLEVDAEVAAEAQPTPPQEPLPPIFGTSLDETLRLDLTDVPRVVLHIIAYLDQSALTQMGIFRISGHNGSVQALKEAIDSGHEVDLTLLNNAHVAATLFKLYLRTLPDTLTCQSRFDEWIGAVAGFEFSILTPRSPTASPPASPSHASPLTPPITPTTDFTPLPSISNAASTSSPQYPDSVVSAIAGLVDTLPPSHARTLDYLIAFCTRVVDHSDQNMMGAKNLASLIAPNILNRPANSGIVNPQIMLEDVSKANKVVECMILNYDRIFANVDYHLKHHPIVSLTDLASEYPLCADRSVKHGASVIVDLPPEEMPNHDSPTVSPKTEELRKRAAKKKTVSSLSLIKDRKLKKKDKPGHGDHKLVLSIGESDFKVPPTTTSSLRPLSPRSLADHPRNASDVAITSSAPAHEAAPGSYPDLLFRTASSPTSMSADDHKSNYSGSTKFTLTTLTDSSNSHKTSSLATSSLTASAEIPNSASSKDSATKPNASPTKDKEARKRDRKSSRPRRPSESKRAATTSSEASAAPSPLALSLSSGNVTQPATETGETSESIPEHDEVAPPVTPTRNSRRHSITIASGEGLDPTKENYGSIGPAAAIGLTSGGSSNLAVDALVDDQSGSMRMRANSRRGSVLTNPYAPLNSRSNSVTQRDRLITPTKARYPSPPVTSSPNRVGGALGQSAHMRESSASPPPFSPAIKEKDGKKTQKDRTLALMSIKFDNAEEFNKVMDDHFGKGPTASYVVLGYNAAGAIRMQAGGEGSVDEMVKNLKEDQIQYCLIRITYYEDGNPLTRDVFVQWNGPKVSAIQKGIKKAHCGEVKGILCPTAIEILASSKNNFTLDTLLARSAPTASRIID